LSIPHAADFSVGINYWPARTAMGWWNSFDRAEVAANFAKLSDAGFDSVRIFLTWEDFQPTPTQVDPTSVENLVTTLDVAHAAGLRVMPTLFTGHMSGVNWIPPWALGDESGDERFRVVALGR
jgi:endo-1,4-beta-mannosidase